MIEMFQALPSEPKVYVCLPVPAFPERWGIRDTVIAKEVIPAARQVAKETGAAIIDLYTPLVGKGEHFPDKIHPNKDGAEVIAETVADAIGVKAVSGS